MNRPGSPRGMSALYRSVSRARTPSAVLLQLHILTMQRDRLAKEKSVLAGRVTSIEEQLARLDVQMKRFERYLLRLAGAQEETAPQLERLAESGALSAAGSSVLLLEY